MKHLGTIAKGKRNRQPFTFLSFDNPHPDYGHEIYCHISNYEEDTFDPGIRVEFDVQPSNIHKDNFQAVNVKRSSRNIVNLFSATEMIGHDFFNYKSVNDFEKITNQMMHKVRHQEMIDKATTSLQNGEICLVMWENPNPSNVVNLDQAKEEFEIWGRSFDFSNIENCTEYLIQKCKDNFPEYIVQKYEGKAVNFYYKSHPLIDKMWKSMIVISKIEQDIEVIVDCREKIIQESYPRLIKQSKQRWTIIGDETGTNDDLTHFWMVVPPGVELPSLSPFFHGTNDKKSLLEPLVWLFRNPNVVLFSFAFEEGKKVKGAGKIAEDSHYTVWLETLPLVLEYVSNRLTDGFPEIEIFSEQVGSLKAGKDLFEAKILDLKTALMNRRGWGQMVFEQKAILAKNPCEHPWMGYPDALAHVFDDEKMEKVGLQKEVVEDLRSRIVSLPFRQTSLNTVTNLLKSSGRPLFFLKSISDMDYHDVDDYVTSLFTGAITEARDALTESQWQDLLKHFKNTAENIQGQHSTNLILQGIDVEQTLRKFTRDHQKFEFLKSVVGTSNHTGATELANKCKFLINEMIEIGNYKPNKQDRLILNNLFGGANDNQFDFNHIRDDFDFENEDINDWSQEAQHLLGAQAQSRALRNEGNDLEIAWEIEDKLISLPNLDDDNLRRRFILRSELLMQKHEYEEARRVLEFDFPKKLGQPDYQLHINDRYFLSTLLKSFALSSYAEEGGYGKFEEISKLVVKSLNDKHPSQRLAYWYIRWANEIAMTEKYVDNVEICLNHLLGLKEIGNFRVDAGGVILACELIDLNKRGLIEEEHESFLEEVLANSEVFANEWVEKNYPNEDDWLAPLNFNYR